MKEYYKLRRDDFRVWQGYQDYSARTSSPASQEKDEKIGNRSLILAIYNSFMIGGLIGSLALGAAELGLEKTLREILS